MEQKWQPSRPGLPKRAKNRDLSRRTNRDGDPGRIRTCALQLGGPIFFHIAGKLWAGMTQNPRFGCESAPYQQSRVTLVEADGATRASQLPGLGSKQGVTMRLTVKSTETLKLPVGKTDHVFWDADVVEFGLRIRAGGSRNWIYQYRIGKRQRRMALGSAKSLPLILARQNSCRLATRA